MRDGDQDEPLAARFGRRPAGALEVVLGLLRLAGPQLGDAEVRERERPQAGVDLRAVELP